MSLGYLDQGKGEAVLLLHGWPVDPFLWRRLIPMLSIRFRVVVPELMSGDMPEQAAAVRGLLDDLGIERYAVVGHSHGGAVAQLLALDGRPPAVMILLDSVAFDAEPPTRLEPLEFIRQGSVEFDSLPQAEIDGYLAAQSRPAPSVAGSLVGREGEMAGWDFPVFILWGEEDPFLPVQVAERLEAALPVSTLGLVPDSGHFLLDDAFDPVGVMISEFLRVMYLGAPHTHEVPLELGWLFRREEDVYQPEEDEEPVVPDPADQEVGPNA